MAIPTNKNIRQVTYEGTVIPLVNPSSGNINITTTNSTDVTNYATAQVVDANLTSSNIKNGISILGISGTFTSDADATSSNILSGKTAYVNGAKITGTAACSVSGTTLEMPDGLIEIV